MQRFGAADYTYWLFISQAHVFNYRQNFSIDDVIAAAGAFGIDLSATVRLERLQEQNCQGFEPLSCLEIAFSKVDKPPLFRKCDELLIN
jgi:hypothetical protein